MSFFARSRHGKSKAGFFFAAMAVVLSAALVGAGGIVATAFAAGNLLTVSKTVSSPSDVTKLAPGDTFTYQIRVVCQQHDCLDATLTDVLPTQLQGFLFQDVQTLPSQATVPRAESWTGCTPTTGSAVTSGCGLSVVFKTPTSESGSTTGFAMSDGQTYTVNLTLKVPATITPGSALDGATITNSATVTASNSPTMSDSADIAIKVPVTSSVALDKDWSTSPQSYQAGAASTITLKATTTSNKNGTTLVIQDPSVAADHAATLDSANPYAYVDFAGFGSISAPSGTTSTTYEYYVKSGAEFTWITGTITGPPAPYANADVVGTRVTFSGDIAQSATATVPISVTQRAQNRTTSADLSGGWTTTNKATTTYAVPGAADASKDASDNFTVRTTTIAASATKTISPASIAAGQTSTGTVSGTNTSEVPVSHLHLEDLGFFSDTLVFGGFSTPIAYPTGATAGTVTWHVTGTPSMVTQSFSSGDKPQPPVGAVVTGFEFDFTSATDSIAVNASTSASFTIAPTASYVPGPTNPVAKSNSVTVTTATAAGKTSAPATKTAPLSVYKPKISVSIDKQIQPTTPVYPGDTVIASLSSGSGTDPAAFTKATTYVITDEATTDASKQCTDMWNAFTVTGIAPTQILANSGLLIEYRDAAGTWHTLKSYPATSSPVLIEGSLAEIGGAGAPAAADVYGIRFTYTDSDGYANGTVVTPYLTFQARQTARFPACASSFPVAGGAAAAFTNTSTVVGEAPNPGDPSTPLSASATDTAPAQIIVPDGSTGVGGIDIAKAWDKDILAAQSSSTANTQISWGVHGTTNYSAAAVSDPGSNESAPENTVFQAFNLLSVSAIPYSSTPYTNGWYLKYDSVSTIELYYGGAWHTVPEPSGGWMSGTGFRGYTLSTTESANTTGIRITVVPNDAARTAAASDPYAPAAGSGIVHSAGMTREFSLAWQLRNVKRVTTAGSPWVTPDQTFNAGAPTGTLASIRNAATLTATPSVGAAVTDSATDDIQINKVDAGVSVKKTTTTPTIVVPHYGDVAPENYPTSSYTVTAKNTSSAKASAVKLVDPMQCEESDTSVCQTAVTLAAAMSDPFASSSYDPASTTSLNPFRALTLTKLSISASIAGEVDNDASRVWLWTRSATGTLASTSYSITQANALTASALVDVIGVSVTFRGTNPDATGGTISSSNQLAVTMTTQLRATLRGTSTPTTAANIGVDAGSLPNHVFGQIYDPVLHPTQPTSMTDKASILPSDAQLGVTAAKSFSPATLTEPQRHTPVSMVLGGTSGTDPDASTLAPDRITVTDVDAGFWNEFSLTAIAEPTAWPSDANRVQVSLQTASGWVDGSVASTVAASVPSAVSLADVTGVRFVFTRVEASAVVALASPTWSLSVPLTVALRDSGRDGGAIVFPSTITNTVSVENARVSMNASKTAQNVASISLAAGSHVLDIVKTPDSGIHTVDVGSPNNWTVTLTNKGAGYTTLTTVVDTLPATLTPASASPSFAFDPGTTMSSPSTAYDATSRTFTFTFATGTGRLAPGEKVVITIPLELQPGLTSGQTATNTVVATTAEALDACTNVTGDQGTTGDWAAVKTTCGTTNYVGPTSGPALFVRKGVQGSLAGAINPSDPSASCAPTVLGTYYRTPCAANSQIDGVDNWVLQIANSGTVNATALTIVDPLPFSGDQYLIGSSSRGSEYQPQLVAGSVEVTTPTGSPMTTTVQVTTDARPCIGADPSTPTWETDPECSSSTWFEPATAADWAKATGIRILVDLHGSQFTPGQQVLVKYKTKNVPESAASADGASVVQPVDDQEAWNQFGIAYKLADQPAKLQHLTPNKAGVHLTQTAIAVTKDIAGAAAQYAPDTILATLVCTVGDDATPVQFSASPSATPTVLTLHLKKSAGYTERVDGIPFGNTSCTVAETGAVGAFGETTRQIAPLSGTVSLTDPVGSSDAVPAAQTVALTNTYEWSGLSVTKKVDTLADKGSFGPFDFQLRCATSDGQTVLFNGGDTESFTLKAGETWSAPAATIPARSVCTLTETGAGHADRTVFTGDGVTQSSGVATIDVGVDPSAVVSALVTNGYDAGTFTVAKKVDGAGAQYGTSAFRFHAVCTYQGVQTLLDETFDLRAGESKTFGVFPSGTSCSAQELASGGATTTSVDPANGTVTIPAQADPATPSTAVVTVTNTFEVGSLTVTKKAVGEYASLQDNVVFGVSAICTFNGAVVVDRTLSVKPGHSAQITQLPLGARCTVLETNKGLADKVSYSAPGGKVALTQAAPNAAVVVTNAFTIDHYTNPGEGSNGGNGLVNTRAGMFVGSAVLLGLAGIALGVLVLLVATRGGRWRKGGDSEKA